MRKVRLKDGQGLIDELKESGQKFYLDVTNSTTIIKVLGIEYSFSNTEKMSGQEMGYVKKVLSYCEKNSSGVFVDRNKIKYIKQGAIKQGYVYKSNLYEIDLNAAYLSYALQKKYISKELFDEGMRLPKKARLVAMGNLARNQKHLYFNGNEFEYIGQTTRELTQGIFYDVSYETDRAMNKLLNIAANDYMFYWVDAIFVKSEKALERVKWYLDSVNLKYKVKNIWSIQRKKDSVIVKESPFAKSGDKDFRVFNFKKNTNINLFKNAKEQKEAETLRRINFRQKKKIEAADAKNINRIENTINDIRKPLFNENNTIELF